LHPDTCSYEGIEGEDPEVSAILQQNAILNKMEDNSSSAQTGSSSSGAEESTGNILTVQNNVELASNDTPRPKGVPEHWTETPTKKSGGKEYVDPANPHNRVRSYPGNPKSPNPSQKGPYVKENINGRPVDRFGRATTRAAPESHIPAERYRYQGRITPGEATAGEGILAEEIREIEDELDSNPE
jgi:hypothetical protein